MRLLCFADLHESVAALKALHAQVKAAKPDAVVCAGDFTVFEQQLEPMLGRIDALGVPVFLVHGNHETEEGVRKAVKRCRRIRFIHKKILRHGDVTLMGWGGGGFDARDAPFERWVKANDRLIRAAGRVVLVVHAPFFGTELDDLGSHCGNRSFSDFIKARKNVILGVCGHFHECAGKEDRLGKATVINPGPRGRVVDI